PKVAGSNPAPATIENEGLADAIAASPFRLPRLHPGIGSARARTASGLTTADFEAAFRVYLDEMERCDKAGCYWALLHLVVVIPDICGALETPGGEATKAACVDW